jgi:hypothetical protein
MNILELIKQQRKVLVITGPPASGKSILADQLVYEYHHSFGDIEEVTRTQPKEGTIGWFTQWNHYAPDKLIIEGEPDITQFQFLLNMMDDLSVPRNQKGAPKDLVPTPQFIVVCRSVSDSIIDHERSYILKLDA